MAQTSTFNVQIDLNALACKRGDRLLFENLSIGLTGGEVLQVVGPNGSGKSSLLRILAGLLPPYRGSVTAMFDGEDADEAGYLCHLLSHQDALKNALSVADNLKFWAGFMDSSGLSVDEALAAVNISHTAHLPAGVLSAGQRRRFAFARLLVAHRPIWLLDEPTAALDKAGDTLAGDLISNHVKAGGIAIAATHLSLRLDLNAECVKTLDLTDHQPDEPFLDEASL